MVSRLLLAAALLGAVCEGQKTNVLFWLADDLGWGDISTPLTNMNNPSDYYETPHLERLAREGMAFNNAYANGAVCSPTRAAILTGQYAERESNKVHTVISMQRSNPSDATLWGSPTDLTVQDDSFTLGEMMKAAGYRTAYIGKFHCGNSDASIINSFGFDANYGGTSAGNPGRYYAINGQFASQISAEVNQFGEDYTQEYVDTYIKPHAVNVPERDMDDLVGRAKHLTDALTDSFEHFMTTGDQSKPFFVFFGSHAVHAPIGDRHARPDLLRKYRNKPRGRLDSNVAYGAIIEGMDQSIGRMISFLQNTPDPLQSGKMYSETTLVILTSDNGGYQPRANNGGLRGEKGYYTEGGIRVPLVAWSQDQSLVKPGVVNPTQVISMDVFATLRTIANGDVPRDHIVDGKSLTNTFATGESGDLNNRALFWHYPGYFSGQYPVAVMRKGDYKLNYFYESSTWTMYNLDTDRRERTNLVGRGMSTDLFNTASSMACELREYLVSSGATYGAWRTTGVQTAPPGPFYAVAGTRYSGPTEDDIVRVVRAGRSLQFTFKQRARLSRAAFRSVRTPDFQVSIPNNLNGDVRGALQAQGFTVSLSTSTGTIGVASGNLGVRSRGEGNAAASRIGAGEELQMTFEQDTLLSALMLRAIDTLGSESMTLRFVSGENPFAAYAGLKEDFLEVEEDRLLFTQFLKVTSSTADFRRYIKRSGGFFVSAGTTLGLGCERCKNSGISLRGLRLTNPANVDHGIIQLRSGDVEDPEVLGEDNRIRMFMAPTARVNPADHTSTGHAPVFLPGAVVRVFADSTGNARYSWVELQTEFGDSC